MQSTTLQKAIDLEWYDPFINDFPHYSINGIENSGILIHADCLEWLNKIPDNSIDAVITDPPYGVKEYDLDQIEKRKSGNGGIWRIPPSFDGNVRSPLPRFTALNEKERERIASFFREFGILISQKLKPGGHLMIASNSFLSQVVFSALSNAKLEFRGQIIRLVRTLRGGDKPKNFEEEFDDICTLPRGCYEPWGLFRKTLPNTMTVGDCLKEFGTGGLRRIDSFKPFEDIIQSNRTSKEERKISDHPSLKPQEFMRKLVYASLPLGKGIILDPFMGSGSTIAASLFYDYKCIGIEKSEEFFQKTREVIPQLKILIPPRLFND